MTIGEKILKMRKARGWSQEELAERLSVSRQAVSRWESGSAKPDADKIIAICDLFGVSADYLLRDMATGERYETAEPSAAPHAVPRHWGSWAMAAFGAVTLFLLRLLASLNRTYIEPVYQISGDGTVTISRSGYYTRFLDFVRNHGLEWLAWLAAILLIAGAGNLLRIKFRNRERKKET